MDYRQTKKSSTATYYLETDWVTLPRIITLTEAPQEELTSLLIGIEEDLKME